MVSSGVALARDLRSDLLVRRGLWPTGVAIEQAVEFGQRTYGDRPCSSSSRIRSSGRRAWTGRATRITRARQRRTGPPTGTHATTYRIKTDVPAHDHDTPTR